MTGGDSVMLLVIAWAAVMNLIFLWKIEGALLKLIKAVKKPDRETAI